jgi:chemotaxis protein methyltransferase CheR
VPAPPGIVANTPAASVTDAEGIEFLRWCLPRLRLAWHGFRLRRIRRRYVYPRIEARMRELALPHLGAYRTHLERTADEWHVLDALCWIPISRFYRDKAVFDVLERSVLPALGTQAMARGETELRCWSAGCAAGEEPYTLAMIWRFRVAFAFPALGLRVVATDIDPELIARARAGSYPAYSVRDVPADIAAQAFSRSPAGYSLRDELRGGVEFVQQDVRRAMPADRFHLILCRNVVLTYFEAALQREILQQMTERLVPSGALVCGRTEAIPEGVRGLEPWSARLGVYRREELTSARRREGPHEHVAAAHLGRARDAP